MIDNKMVYQVYKNMESFLHEEQGHVKQVSKQSRQTVQDSMISLNITPQDHAEAMTKIADIYRTTNTEEDFEKEIRVKLPILV